MREFRVVELIRRLIPRDTLPHGLFSLASELITMI